MLIPQSSLPGRVLRVGVTGARELDPTVLAQLRAQVGALLASLAAWARRDAVEPISLELLSPLAEGADRLVAELALAERFSLVGLLPFPAAEYERDFSTSASVAAFRDLLAQAEGRVLALDGSRGDDEARSYEAVGRTMVRNCDLIIGIWNGRPGKGLGGTADTIRYAASFGPPVIWYHAEEAARQPSWIEQAHDLHSGAPTRAVEPALALYLDRLLIPPAGRHHRGTGLLHEIGRLAWSLRHAIGGRFHRRKAPSNLVQFLAEQPHPVRGPWRAYGWFMRTLSGRNPPFTPDRQPTEPTAAHWFAHHQQAGARAREYAARYRSSYVWVFAFGAVALSTAALSLASGEWLSLKVAATIAELASLGVIVALVVMDGLANWHRRAIEYRLLAELCRKQQALAPLAWAVPRASGWANTAPPRAHERDAPHGDDAAWVSWLFSAWLRAAPLPSGVIGPAWVAAARDAALHDLIDDQIEYHRTRRAQCHRAGHRLVRAGECLFLLVVTLVALKLWLLLSYGAGGIEAMHGWLVALGLAGAILPALSAALVGIRAYAEMELLADQSHVLLDIMERARARIVELDPAAPLASQRLGSALASLTTIMLEDLEGWARLFRAKVIEA